MTESLALWETAARLRDLRSLNEDAWKPLLSAALGVLDDLRDRGFGAPHIVLGGGTVLMSTEEILAKKLYFRAGLLKPRDVFDLVAAYRAAPDAVRRALAASSRRRDEQLRRLKALAGLPFEAASADIVAMRECANLPSTMFAEAGAIFAESP